MKKTIRTAGIQLAPTTDPAQNLKRAAELIGLASGEGALITTLPQLFNLRWFPRSIDTDNLSLAENEDGPTVTALRETASANKTVIIAPVFEVDDGARYNTAFVIGAGGEIIGKYRKMHVPQIPLWEEREYFSPGDLGFPVFDTPHARIGVQICWDVFFPEGFRILALKGADVVFVPTASAFEHSRGKWERAVQAAAHANGLFIFRVNRVGAEEKQEFYGGSFCARPDGEMTAAPSGASDGVVLVDMDLSEVSRARNEWVFMKDRRPAEYADLHGEGR